MSDHLSNHSFQKSAQKKIIGLIPAAGQATRLNPLPFSKELYPIGFKWMEKPHNLHPKPVCADLLEKMRLAGTTQAFIVIRDGKWDIPAFFTDGKMLDMHLAYLMMDLPYGVPFTLDQAYPFVQNSTVVFGFPDIIFRPDNAYVSLLSKQTESAADIVLGLFKAENPHTMDMVGLNEKGQVSEIKIKPKSTTLCYTWIIAVWGPTFTRFLHEHVSMVRKRIDPDRVDNEIFLSEVIVAAIQNGIQVDKVIFDSGTCLDIGSPENLVKAIRKH